MISLRQEIIDRMKCYGFDVSVDINLVLDGDNELKEKIEHEKEVSVSTQSNVLSNVKKEDSSEKKSPYRAKKSSEITAIKDVIY